MTATRCAEPPQDAGRELPPADLLSVPTFIRTARLRATSALRRLRGAPWVASGMWLTEVTWRTCALVMSQSGMIRGIWPWPSITGRFA
jgi:hypothetical protein